MCAKTSYSGVVTTQGSVERVPFLTPLGPQSRFGDKLLEIGVVCPQNGTAVLNGLNGEIRPGPGFFFLATRW